MIKDFHKKRKFKKKINMVSLVCFYILQLPHTLISILKNWSTLTNRQKCFFLKIFDCKVRTSCFYIVLRYWVFIVLNYCYWAIKTFNYLFAWLQGWELALSLVTKKRRGANRSFSRANCYFTFSLTRNISDTADHEQMLVV